MPQVGYSPRGCQSDGPRVFGGLFFTSSAEARDASGDDHHPKHAELTRSVRGSRQHDTKDQEESGKEDAGPAADLVDDESEEQHAKDFTDEVGIRQSCFDGRRHTILVKFGEQWLHVPANDPSTPWSPMLGHDTMSYPMICALYPSLNSASPATKTVTTDETLVILAMPARDISSSRGRSRSWVGLTCDSPPPISQVMSVLRSAMLDSGEGDI